MPRNTIKGVNKRPGSNLATGRKYTYDKKYQTKKVGYRVSLNKANRGFGTYGNKDGFDVSHSVGGFTLEKAKLNRARKSTTFRKVKGASMSRIRKRGP